MNISTPGDLVITSNIRLAIEPTSNKGCRMIGHYSDGSTRGIVDVAHYQNAFWTIHNDIRSRRIFNIAVRRKGKQLKDLIKKHTIINKTLIQKLNSL